MIRLRWVRGAAFIAALLFGAVGASAAEQAYERLDPNSYQSFVANWTPDNWPLCAVIRTRADWDRVLKPAATMHNAKPFAPPAEFWKFKAVLLVAYVIGAGDTEHVFRVAHVMRDKHGMELDYHFTPTPSASSTMKWYLAVAVPKPLPKIVRFNEGRRTICTLQTHAMIPISPR